MFLDPDRTRPLTKRVLSAQFKAALEKVGYEGPPLGLHGVRVSGYNESRLANGEDLTAVHGIWMGPKKSWHGRYVRFNMLDVANISARMCGAEDVYAPQASARRIVRQPPPQFQPEREEVAEEGAGERCEEAEPQPFGAFELDGEGRVRVRATEPEVINVASSPSYRSGSSVESSPAGLQIVSPPVPRSRDAYSPPVSSRLRYSGVDRGSARGARGRGGSGRGGRGRGGAPSTSDA